MTEAKKVNKMDKINYTKDRLLTSLRAIQVAIEDGEKLDTIDLHISHVIQEINTKPPFKEIEKVGKFCSFCFAKHSVHTVRFSRFHLNLLTKIFNFVVKTWNYRFRKKDIKGLSHTEYGNFFQLQRFWLLFFPIGEDGKKCKTGEWWMPLKRVAGFLRWDVFISQFYIRDSQAKINTPSEAKIRVFDVPKKTRFEEIPDFVSYDNLENN